MAVRWIINNQFHFDCFFQFICSIKYFGNPCWQSVQFENGNTSARTFPKFTFERIKTQFFVTLFVSEMMNVEVNFKISIFWQKRHICRFHRSTLDFVRYLALMKFTIHMSALKFFKNFEFWNFKDNSKICSNCKFSE
jgi:hypothetical protein